MNATEIQVPARPRETWELHTEPLYLFQCLGCGSNVGHNHRLDDCLKTLRRDIADLKNQLDAG